MSNWQYTKNKYKCNKCGGTVNTIDRDDGVTPFIIKCKTNLCDGKSQSQIYRVDQNIKADFEWYRWTIEERETARIAEKINSLNHDKNGGLFLRKIEPFNFESHYKACDSDSLWDK